MNEGRRWLSILLAGTGFLFCASLILWWFYLMANWPVLISIADNPYDSHASAYLIWIGFGLYPIIVALAFALSWKFRGHSRIYIPLLVAFLPILNILLFLGGVTLVAKSAGASFEKFAQEVARTPSDFGCSDERYIQIKEDGTVGLVNRAGGGIQDTWIGNVDFNKMSFTRATASDWPTADELSTCRNAEGRRFFEVYKDSRS